MFRKAVAETSAASDQGANAGPGARDPAWDALPHSDFDVARYLARRPGAVEAKKLFRNTTLNPRDLYIPPGHRRVLEGLVAKYTGLFREVREVRRDTMADEMKDLVDAGRVQGVDTARLTARAQMARMKPEDRRARLRELERNGMNPDTTVVVDPELVGAGPIVGGVIRNGKFYPATLAKLPETRQSEEMSDFLATELAGQVTGFFLGQSAINQSQQIAILARIADLRKTAR